MVCFLPYVNFEHPAEREQNTRKPWLSEAVKEIALVFLRVDPLQEAEALARVVDPGIMPRRNEFDTFGIGEVDERSRRVDVVVPVEPIAQQTVVPAKVSDVVQGRNSVSFRVDTVGTPVLVRTSYFPNWSVSGAKGPYRVAPNMMVVVPTENEVKLSFGWSLLDVVAYVLTAVGIYVLVRWRRSRKPQQAELTNLDN